MTIYQPGDLVRSRYDYEHYGVVAGQEFILVQHAGMSRVWETDFKSPQQGGVVWMMHEDNFELVSRQLSPVPSSTSLNGDWEYFTFTSETKHEETPQERADRIWEALHGVAKPN